VENVAFRKSSWINNKRQYKRHVRSQWTRGHASRAVDGDVVHSCTVLDNYYVDRPTWMVDLGQRTTVAGVKIVTWQGKERGTAADNLPCSLKPNSIKLSWSQTGPKLVADLSQTCYSLLAS